MQGDFLYATYCITLKLYCVSNKLAYICFEGQRDEADHALTDAIRNEAQQRQAFEKQIDDYVKEVTTLKRNLMEYEEHSGTQ